MEDSFLSIFSSILIPIISIIAILIIGIVTWRYNKKQHDRTAMIDVFHMLNNSTHKNAEEFLRQAYSENKLMSVQHIVDEHKQSAITVERNYDQIGVLIREKLIPNNPYYVTFGSTTVVSYRILYDELKKKRHILKKKIFVVFAE